MIDYKTERSKVPDNLLATNILPPPPAVMAAMVRNHLVIAQSTSCDSTLAEKSRQELMKWKGAGYPSVDAYFKRLDDAAASKPTVDEYAKRFTVDETVEHQQHMARDAARFELGG